MEVTWIEARELPEGEKVYLKKDFLGYRVIEPWKNQDGSINWFNLLLGGKRNLFMLLVIILIAVSVYFGIHEQLEQAKKIAENPCEFVDCVQGVSNSLKLNFSNLIK